MSVFGEKDSCHLCNFLQTHLFWDFDQISRIYNQTSSRNIWFLKKKNNFYHDVVFFSMIFPKETRSLMPLSIVVAIKFFLNNGNNHYSITRTAAITVYLKKSMTHVFLHRWFIIKHNLTFDILFDLTLAGDNAVKVKYFNFSQCILCWYVCRLIKVTQWKLRTIKIHAYF